jgi:AraC-like DNA-binding protein
VTPPQKVAGGRSVGQTLHTRPRSDFRDALRPLMLVERARGGLPPGVLRRIHEYVDAHVSENIELSDLAAVAGLSVFHFAREFKRSVGVTPHLFLLQRRVDQAKAMLARSDLSLSEIAVVLGFADQSHFTRRFREFVGTTPNEYRWSLR